MSQQHTITIEGKEYSYADYLTKVFDYVQLKGFNKEAFQHVSALLWDLDKRVTDQAAEIAALKAAAEVKPAAAAKAEAKPAAKAEKAAD